MWILMSYNGFVHRISNFDKLRLSKVSILYIKTRTLWIPYTSFSRSAFKSSADEVHINLTLRSCSS